MVDLATFKIELTVKRQDALARIARVPVAVLVWGPTPTSTDPVSLARLKLRDALRANGHVADFSEDLYEPTSPLSLFAQQLAQAEVYDVVFSIPSSFGAIAEVHDFARLTGISRKLIAFIDQAYQNGYSNQSLMAAQSSASCKVELYDGFKLPTCIIDHAIGEVRRLQEIFYMTGRR
jgi:hypothetical protein